MFPKKPTPEASTEESDQESKVWRSERSTKWKHSNPHKLPKSVMPDKVTPEQVSVSNANPGKNFEEFGKAVVMLGESLGQALRA